MNANLGNRVSYVNPLLMSFTPKGKIEEAEDIKYSYNDFTQTTEYDMRTIGTKSLKTSCTRKKNGSGKTAYYSSVSDSKNATDDSKTVK